MNIQQLNTKVLDTMLEMLKPNNTLTTLELKLELKNKGISLNQETISKFMSVKADEGLLSYTDNGTYRTYSLIKQQPIKTQSTIMDYPKTEIVNKTTLIETLKNNKGKRLTIVFTTKDKEIRKYNGMFTGHVSNLGWYQFRLRSDNEGNKVYKQFDAKNLLEVRVNKVIYKLEEVKKKKEFSFTITDGTTTYKQKIPVDSLLNRLNLEQLHDKICNCLDLDELDFKCIKGC